MSRKLRVGVLFGGRSGEHEISLLSAKSVLAALDRDKYDVTEIGIDRDGRWLLSENPMKALSDDAAHRDAGNSLVQSERHGVLSVRAGSQPDAVSKLDIVFPVLHGPYGEDGTVQGLLEMAGLPYVGAGVLGSAVGMDKAVMKALLSQAGLNVSPYRLVLAADWRSRPEAVASEVVGKFGYPIFVKPANLGSSVGISKVHDDSEFAPAMELAAQYDRRILVEQAVEDAREIECSVLGNDRPDASICGEIFPAGEFYDYESKYFDDRSRTVIPADLPDDLHNRIRAIAVDAFTTLDISGMARVDFLLRRADNRVFVLEANTIPGFTQISMYAKLWEASGIPYAELLDRLIELGLERFRERSELRVTR